MSLMHTNGQILLIGDPRFNIMFKHDLPKQSKGKNTDIIKVPFLYWTGINWYWDPEPGESIIQSSDPDHIRYHNYISHICGWKYSLEGCSIAEDKVGEYFDIASLKNDRVKLTLQKHFFCTNRYNNGIAFSIRYAYEYIDRHHVKRQDAFGEMIFLPEITLNEEETLNIVLHDLCGVTVSEKEPDWTRGIIAPGQQKIDHIIESIEFGIESLETRLRKAESLRKDARMYLKLLYETGFGLESIVMATLEMLGASVEYPSEKNVEDGWICINIDNKKYEGVLEIKGTKSDTFSEAGRKQVTDWVNRGISLRQKKYQGIFIGNSANQKPLSERSWPFSDSWEKAAVLSEICALRTQDLYTIYLLHHEKILDTAQFWSDLFMTNGIFDITPYQAQYDHFNGR